MHQEGTKLLPHVYGKSTVFSDAEPSRPVTLLNVLHPGVENTQYSVKRTENILFEIREYVDKKKGSQGERGRWRK